MNNQKKPHTQKTTNEIPTKLLPKCPPFAQTIKNTTPANKKNKQNKTKELSFTLDITEEIAVVSYEPDDEVKEKKNITLTTEVIPFYLEKLDAIAQDNQGHLALGRVCNFPSLSFLQFFRNFLIATLFFPPPFYGAQLTWADVYFAGILDYLNYMVKIDLIEKYPNLKRVVNGVNDLEQIKAWLEKRPPTDV